MPLPGEVVQISCGPAELVWAVLWEGQFIVREGISRDCPKGKESAGPGGWGVVMRFQPLYLGNMLAVPDRYLLGSSGLTQS